MAISAGHVRQMLTAYEDAHPEEKDELAVVWDLLGSGADLTTRKEFRGHVTANAILADPDGRILFIHHLVLGQWLTPGGHLEPGDSTLLGAALRELVEETGVRPEYVTPLGQDPIHIDIHPIPANPKKGEPEHRHIDFRFVFTTTVTDVTEIQVEEVTDAAWRGVGTITDERLRARVASALNVGTGPKANPA